MTKILVVDDDLLVLATITMGLQQLGYLVLQADNGPDALTICSQITPDLALLDIRMPSMSGLELAKLLNEQMIPFVFLSAYCDEEMVKSAAEVGALGYLIKPLEISRIVPAIEVALLRADQQFKAVQTIDNLNSALSKNRDIDIAIGLLMERHQVNRVIAFELLREYARSHRIKIVDVATAVIDGSPKLCLSPPTDTPKK